MWYKGGTFVGVGIGIITCLAAGLCDMYYMVYNEDGIHSYFIRNGNA